MPEETNTGDELNTVFRNGSVFNASQEDLNRFLKHLCSGHVDNEKVRHREMNRCQVINTIKTFRFIDSVERSNQTYTAVIVILTIITVALSLYSIMQSSNSSKQIDRLISAQEIRSDRQREYLQDQVTEQRRAFEIIVHDQRLLIESLAKEQASNKTTTISPPPPSAVP